MEVQKLRTEVTASKARCESLRSQVAKGAGTGGLSRRDHLSNNHRGGESTNFADDEEGDEDERLELGGGDKSAKDSQAESERILHHLQQFDETFLKRFQDVKKVSITTLLSRVWLMSPC